MDVELTEKEKRERDALNEIYSELREGKITLDEFYEKLVPVVGIYIAQGMLEAELPTEFIDEDGRVCEILY